MGRKEDWKEIEEFERKKEQENIEKYGINVTKKYEELKNKSKDSTKKRAIIKIVRTFLKTIIVLLTIFVIFNFYTVFKIVFSNITSAHNVNVKESIESSTNIKIELISKNEDEKKFKGEYYFKVKKCPEIHFFATKNYGQEKNDLSENLHRYLFEKWDNPNKNKFEKYINRTNEGFLEYKTYININTYDELLEGTELIIEFLEYVEKWNIENGKVINIWYKGDDEFVYPLGQIYLMKNDNIITPYREWFQTKEGIIKEAKEQYEKLENQE